LLTIIWIYIIFTIGLFRRDEALTGIVEKAGPMTSPTTEISAKLEL
jgi:hypothetical protein